MTLHYMYLIVAIINSALFKFRLPLKTGSFESFGDVLAFLAQRSEQLTLNKYFSGSYHLVSAYLRSAPAEGALPADNGGHFRQVTGFHRKRLLPLGM